MKLASEITLLIVDDEQFLCNAIASDFKRKGYNVLCAYNGRQAFELVKANTVNLIISDIRMPGGDGVELLTNVKNYNHEYPELVFITGFADLPYETAYDLGANAILAKPFNRKTLFETVENALQSLDEKWQPRPSLIQPNLKIDLKNSTLDHAVSAKIINFGRGGMFVSYIGPIHEPNMTVLFKIEFQDEAPIEGEGIVRWVRHNANAERPAECGIEFVSLNPNAKEKISQWLGLRKTKAYIPKAAL